MYRLFFYVLYTVYPHMFANVSINHCLYFPLSQQKYINRNTITVQILLKYWIWPHFASRIPLILHATDSPSCCKNSSEILVHVDTIASQSCCRFDGCLSMMWIFLSNRSQRCSFGLGSCDKTVWVQWTHCHVKEASLRWFEFCAMVVAGSSHQKYTIIIKGWTWSQTSYVV